MPDREVPLEFVLALYGIERRRQRGYLVVDVQLLRSQRYQVAVTVVDETDRVVRPTRSPALRPSGVLGIPEPPPRTESTSTLNAARFGSICTFASSTFRLFFDTSSGVNSSMQLIRR